MTTQLVWAAKAPATQKQSKETVSQIVLRFAPKWFACSELLNLQLLHWKVLGKCKLSAKVNLIKAEYFCNGQTVITKAFVGKDV